MIIGASDYMLGSNPYAVCREAMNRGIPCAYRCHEGDIGTQVGFKIAITNNGRWIADWENKVLKVNLQHGQMLLGDVKPERGIEIYLVASDFDKEMHIRNGFDPSNVFVVEGRPRLDFLYKMENADVLAEVISLGLNPYRRNILYAPTWSRAPFGGGKRSFFGNWFKDQDQETQAIMYLIKAARDNECNLILRLHGHYVRKQKVPDYIKKIIEANKDVVAVTSMIDQPNSMVQLAATSVLITDYSSIAADFLPTNRPIIFIEAGQGWIWNPLEDKWHIRPEKRAEFGALIDDYKLFPSLVQDCIENPGVFEKGRKKYRELLLGTKNDGNVSSRALDIILAEYKKRRG